MSPKWSMDEVAEGQRESRLHEERAATELEQLGIIALEVGYNGIIAWTKTWEVRTTLSSCEFLAWKRSWCTFLILDQFASTCLGWRISLEQFIYFPFGPRSFSLLVSYANFCGVFGSFPRAAIFTKPAKRIDATGGDEPFMSCRIKMNQHHIT